MEMENTVMKCVSEISHLTTFRAKYLLSKEEMRFTYINSDNSLAINQLLTSTAKQLLSVLLR